MVMGDDDGDDDDNNVSTTTTTKDVPMTRNKIVVSPTAKAVMDPIATVADADGPSAVTVMLLDEDCEEGEEDDYVTDEVMQELWWDDEDKDKDKDKNIGGKVEGEDGNGGVIDDEVDGGGAR